MPDRSGRAADRTGPLRAGGWAAGASLVVLATAGLVGLVLRQPWLFPSLGPTIMVITETPRSPAARPRHVLAGHLVGVAAGYLALVATGLTRAPGVVQQGITVPRIVAACLSLALTAFVLQTFDLLHAPAGATTLIVSLGILKTPSQLLVVLLSVLLVTVLATGLDAAADARRRVRHAGG